MARKTLQNQVLTALGSQIVDGTYPVGGILRSEDLAVKYDVSLTVIRETLKVLQSMRLVALKPRVGITVREPRDWNVFDPRVIQWRLATTARTNQLRSLTELRSAVEPTAAFLAAIRASDEERARLVELADLMEQSGSSRQLELFMEQDVAFHTTLLHASRNEMFIALTEPITEALTGRHRSSLMPQEPLASVRDHHRRLAQAIFARRGDEARVAANEILDSVLQETDAQVAIADT
ncbi:FadR/GntR family transcriptional regulator [Paenarthrobacter sp. NPDC089675]|uniref:FadR/GntR family transcriptional regulator n=1 Tax=Paenarthrobacter TaxID=1742992 RepID=UPI00382F737A